MTDYELIVIGGGCAGISAALSAHEAGIAKILLIEREPILGGILNQCIHHGFGLSLFGRDLTGPEFAERLICRLNRTDITVLTESSVLSLRPGYVELSGSAGYFSLSCRAVILASGCREIPIGALPVCGSRPSGIFTAGQAQRMINLDGLDIGDDVLILGSGDVGMIVARRLRIMGKNVIAVIEKSAFCGGLEANRASCLETYSIPLSTSRTVTKVYGAGRITGVDICAAADGSITHIPCRTLITSVGLVPDCSLLGHDIAPAPGIFLCGNCRTVHSTADDASADGAFIGRAAAEYLKSGSTIPAEINAKAQPVSGGIRCICCPHQCVLTKSDGKLHGGLCKKFR